MLLASSIDGYIFLLLVTTFSLLVRVRDPDIILYTIIFIDLKYFEYIWMQYMDK